jgi:hypothetical protein
MEARQTLETLASFFVNMEQRHLHKTNNKESRNGEFLPQSKTQLEDLDNGKSQDDDVHHKMRQTSSKKELCVVDIAGGILNRMVPVCLHRDAMEDDHESTEDEPDACDYEHNLDGDSDGGLLKDAPVEKKNRQLGQADGVAVAERDEELHESRVKQNVFSLLLAQPWLKCLTHVPLDRP